MIPLTRRAAPRKLETALLSCSRQSLPRPARLYSTPTRRNEAQVIQNDLSSSAGTFPAYASGPLPSKTGDDSNTDLNSFLRRQLPYTYVPTPLPSDVHSTLHDYYFPNTQTQDALAVIDACLHGNYDIPRARYVFSQLREGSTNDSVLSTRLYNLFLETYLETSRKEENEKSKIKWIEEAWKLFADLESGSEPVSPNASTYASALKILRATEELGHADSVRYARSASDMLNSIITRKISISTVIADRAFTSEEAQDVVQVLSREAAEKGLSSIIKELGQVESLAVDPLKDVPEVLPARSSKSSSSEIEEDSPFNIANLRKHLAEVAYAQRVLPDDISARQKLLESSVYDLAVERMQHDRDNLEERGINSGKLQHAQLQTWMFKWHEKLTRRLAFEITELVEEEKKFKVTDDRKAARMRLGPFLTLLKPEKLSLITILELMSLSGSGGVTEGMKTARALITVGKAIEMEHKAEILKKNNVSVPSAPKRPSDNSFFTNKAYEELKEWRKNAAEFAQDNADWTSTWTHPVRARLGSFLVDCLMDVATVERKEIDKRTGEEVTEEHPAFYHSYEYLRGHRLGVIRLNTIVADRMSKDNMGSALRPRHLPMLIRPKPWISHNDGGYLFNRTSVMRLKDTQEQLTYLRHATLAGHMEHVFAGLDVLGSTPWKINAEVFNVVLALWNSGKRFGKIPADKFEESDPEPVKPDNYDSDVLAKSRYLQAMKEWMKEKANNHSTRCSVNYRVEIARAFLADTFYLPHNIDFRGRAYPIPIHLNHIGDDICRGLLKFGEAKKLGARGLRWLKIHLANLYGYDKGSFEERVNFVHEHLEDIYDSAERPLEGKQWWAKADDPFQCLATCIELRNALESGDPEGFESSLPIHQDGTCNGLQHYAALGGDIHGARQVNLAVTDRPADVYTYVASMVEEIIKKDVEKGNAHAIALQGKIARKIVKQTVMTTVYGVTFIGARDQIMRQLRLTKEFETADTWELSSYLARLVLGCIGNLFEGAKSIQDWLTISARLIAKSIPRERVEAALLPRSQNSLGTPPSHRLPKEQMTSVVWTTPLGLPIVQPYRKTKRKQVMTSLQTVFISDPNTPTEVNTSKQASAFPPNFIHSLDATHMMLTALECNKLGIAFASVHDSYWTHAGTVDTMNGVIRETFIALHESNVLERLRDEFLDRYKDYQVPIVRLKTSGRLISKVKLPSSALQVVADTPEAEARLDALAGEDISLEDVDLTEGAEDADTTKSATTSAKKAGGRAKKGVDGEAKVQSKFINLVDLLPPLPKKGDFDVKTIKKSQYFFS